LRRFPGCDRNLVSELMSQKVHLSCLQSFTSAPISA
jgi:hypothetical protein